MKIKQNSNISITDKAYYIYRTILIIGLPLTIFSTLALSLSHSSAYNQSSDSISLSIPVSCTLNATVSSLHSVSMVSGTYQSDIGSTTMKTTCNDTNGYVVYAIGNTNNEEGNNTLSSTVLGQDYNIPTGLNTSAPASGEDASNWAMKLAPVAENYTPTLESDYDNKYALVPNTWSKVASRISGTMDMTEGSSFTTTYAIYLKATQPAGTYAGQVKYVMFHPSSSPKPVPTIEDAYELAGKTKVDHILDPETGEYGSYYTMQDMTTGICEAVSLVDEATETKLVDVRDNKLYYVTKLQDGHCWMTQNLDLDLDSSVALTSETTDLNDGSLGGAYSTGYSVDNGIISWLPTNSTREKILLVDNDMAHSANPGKYYWDNNASIISCNYINTACEFFSQTPYTSNKAHGSIGNYYNWSAAIASNNSYLLDTNTYNDIQASPQNSICSKGWRLPTISSQSTTDEFTKIKNLYQNLTTVPPYLVRSGFAVASYAGYEAGYWSSTVIDARSARYLLISGNNTTTNASIERSRGWSIRCLAR